MFIIVNPYSVITSKGSTSPQKMRGNAAIGANERPYPALFYFCKDTAFFRNLQISHKNFSKTYHN